MAGLHEGTGVDYVALDAFKRRGQAAAAHTEDIPELVRLRAVPFKPSRGESAFLIDCGDHYAAQVQEGLGTKRLVADAMIRIADSLACFLRGVGGGHLGIQSYKMRWCRNISRDAVAMIVNDMITVGALPTSIAMHLAVGDASWLADEMRAYGLLDGWRLACRESGCAYGHGETSELKGIINPDTAELSGSAIGVIRSGCRPLLPETIRPGDGIIFCESSGIHANCLTKAREIAAALPGGYLTA